MNGHDLLIIIGMGLQVAGILVVVREVWSGYRAARRYAERPQLIHLTASWPMTWNVGEPTVTGGEVQRPPDDRICDLEARLDSLTREVERVRSELPQMWRNEIDAVKRELRDWSQERINEIRGLVEALTVSGNKWKLVSVALLVTGVVLQGVGSL